MTTRENAYGALIFYILMLDVMEKERNRESIVPDVVTGNAKTKSRIKAKDKSFFIVNANGGQVRVIKMMMIYAGKLDMIAISACISL